MEVYTWLHKGKKSTYLNCVFTLQETGEYLKTKPKQKTKQNKNFKADNILGKDCANIEF